MMKILRTLCVTLLSATVLLQASASVEDLPVTTVDGKTYYYYEVQPKETIYSLTHKLGVTKEDIIRHNPSVADGLKAHSTLYFPATSPSDTRTHQVEKGETIYGIAKKYGITTDRLIELNPSLNDGLKAGQQIKVPNAAPSAPGLASTTTFKGHIVSEGETFYSIAHNNGITVAQLEAANPDVKILKTGQVINIPSADTQIADTTGETNQSSTIVITENTPVKIIEPAIDTTVSDTDNAGEIKVAVALPFMLVQGSKPSKNAQRFTEFYKGFLLAVDSMRNIGSPIKVYTFDTAANTDSVKSILSRPELKLVQLIIAPDDETHLAMFGAFGRENNINIFNPFVVKDESYLTNRAMMQANIPHDRMYHKAIEGLTRRFEGYTPVILNRTDGATDKQEYIEQLKKELSDNGITYNVINFTNKLSAANLKPLQNGRFVFIPVSGKKAEADRILPALAEFRETFDEKDCVRVFGYPEWITFRGETLTNMSNLNTVIYSRFHIDDEDIQSRDIEARFKKWYGGRGIENAVPKQGLFGFDTGMYLIRALYRNNGDFKDATPSYSGVQNSFRLTSPGENAGYYNDVLYFINYRPSGMIDKTTL